MEAICIFDKIKYIYRPQNSYGANYVSLGGDKKQFEYTSRLMDRYKTRGNWAE
jgi:hypothetical protein